MLIYKSILPDHSLLAFWKMEETEEQLYTMCDLHDEDLKVIANNSAHKRRIELLSVRALLKAVGINQTIHYNDRKPYLDNGYISISHSTDFAAIIYSPEHPVGIDIEKVSPKIQNIASRVFSDKELAAADGDLEKLTVLWNCKECVVKLANNDGIDFREMIDVDMPSDFSLQDNIIIHCTLKKTEHTKVFLLSAMKIEGNMVVWGRLDDWTGGRQI